MKGTIHKINWDRGMAAVLTEQGGFSIFEMLGDDTFEEGDEVSWENDTGLGSEMLKNLTQNETLEVYFQNHWVSKSQLKDQLFY